MNEEVKIKEDFMISAVPPQMIDLVWDQCIPLINRVIAITHGDITLDALRNRLLRGSNLLVTISQGKKIIAVNVLSAETLDSGKRVLYIPIIAGDKLELWTDRFLEVAKMIAKDFNCTELRGLSARKGWMRILKNYGWEESFVTVRCEIGE